MIYHGLNEVIIEKLYSDDALTEIMLFSIIVLCQLKMIVKNDEQNKKLIVRCENQRFYIKCSKGSRIHRRFRSATMAKYLTEHR